MSIKFTYLQQPLNKYTFKAPKVKAWVEDHCKGDILNLFAGEVRLTLLPHQKEVRVDLDSTLAHIDYCMDALDFVIQARKNCLKFDTALLNPPYSYRKSMELYKGNLNSRFKQIFDLIPEILAPDGCVITFGHHSNVMSKKRGFAIREICLISHGGAQHDTIVTAEQRIKVTEKEITS